MKIDRIDTFPVTAQIVPARAIRNSGGLHDRSPFLFVRIRTTDGVDGIGEASCTLAWSGEDHVTVERVIRQVFEPLLIGADPTRIEWLTATFDRAIPGHIFAKSAVEMALWDIAGKVAGLPVFKLLGGKVRDVIRTKFSISGAPPAEAAKIAEWAVEAGFRAVKVKVGINPEEDIQRVSAVRAAIGPDVLLGVDANGGWSPSDAIRAIRQLENCNIAFAEQPIAAGDPARLVHVRASVGVPVMADESLFTLHDALTLAKADAVDCFSIYAGKGGLGPARKMAAVAEAAGIACTVGSNLELGVGAAAQIHLALATAAIRDDQFPCDILTPFYYEEDFVLEAHPIIAGEARALDKPGLGVELNETALTRFRSH